VDITGYTRKDIGNLGERVAAEYARRLGFTVIARNVARKTGELDVVARKGKVLHVIEVKTLVCEEFPTAHANRHHPGDNLHLYKIRKVARTAEWYVADIKWAGEWQVDGVLVWLRKRDALAKVRYVPQIIQ
jgi:putative endonuclease